MVLLKLWSAAEKHQELRGCLGMTLEFANDLPVESPGEVTDASSGCTSLELCFRTDPTDTDTIMALAAPFEQGSGHLAADPQPGKRRRSTLPKVGEERASERQRQQLVGSISEVQKSLVALQYAPLDKLEPKQAKATRDKIAAQKAKYTALKEQLTELELACPQMPMDGVLDSPRRKMHMKPFFHPDGKKIRMEKKVAGQRPNP
eukprot:gene16924-biopygen8899